MNSKGKRFVPAELFDVCVIDGVPRSEIRRLLPGTKKGGTYYLEKFAEHLKKHRLSIKDYCTKHLGVDWPKCPISGEDVGFRWGRNLMFSDFKQHRIAKDFSPRLAAWSERMSKSRRGSGNPMFGRPSWNKGLDASDPRIERVRQARIGAVASEETRKKQRAARAASPIKARHTTPHSAATVEKMRRETASRYGNGVFKKKTRIHIKIGDILTRLGLDPQEEFQIDYYAVDYALASRKIAIEADGDYFHCHPEKYPDGPEDSIQRRNVSRDIHKKAHLDKEGWTLLRYWERDINKETFEEKLRCDLKKLQVL